MTTLKITIPDETARKLEAYCRRQHQSAEEAVQEILRRRLAVEELRALSAEIRPMAEARGFDSEDDILESIS